jgi:hypothetical protein
MKKGGLIYMPPHNSSNLPTSYSYLFDISPGTTEAAAATPPIAGDEVLLTPGS